MGPHLSTSETVSLRDPFTRHLPSKDAFFLLLSFAFSPKEATSMAQSKNLFSQALQKYSDNQLTVDLVQFSSFLLSLLFTQKQNYKTQTSADLQSPLERESPNMLSLS